MYRQLGHAIYGDRKMAGQLVDLADGRRGHLRHRLIRAFEAAWPAHGGPALREFQPQDLVKRNRGKVFAPVATAQQIQAEAIAYVVKRKRTLWGLDASTC